MSFIASYAAVFTVMLIGLAILEWQIQTAPRRDGAPADYPRSHKHIRVTHRTFDVKIAYYGHDGRKLTVRTYPMARYYAALQSARAKGYRYI